MLKLIAGITKMLTRDKTAMFFTLFFPLMMTFIFGLATKAEVKPVKLAVVQAGADEAAEELVDQIRESKGPEGEALFVVREVKNEGAVRTLIEEGDIDAGLVVPLIGEGGTVTLLYDEKSPERLGRVQATLRGIIQTYNLSAADAEERVKVAARGLRADKGLGSFDFLVPTLLMFGVVFGTMTATAARFAKLQEDGTFKRLQVTPLKPYRFAAAETVVKVIISFIQAGLVLLIASAVYEADVLRGIGWSMFLVAIGTILFTNLGILIAAKAGSSDAASSMGALIAALFFFTGGGGISEAMPNAVVEVFARLPFALLVDQIKTVTFDGTTPFADRSNSLLLAGWLVVVVAASMRTFRFADPKPAKVKER